MLHILWLAIKFIGMLLALILAILLLTVLLVLFCPLRYRVKIRKTVDEWEAWGRVSWLFGLVKVTVQKGNAGAGTQIHICGIRPRSLKKLFARKKKFSKKQSKRQPEKELEKQQDLPGADTDVSQAKTVFSEHLDAVEEEKEEAKQQQESFFKRNPLKRLWMRIVEKCKSVWKSFMNFCNTVKNMYSKINLWKDFLGDSHTSEALRLTWQQLFRVIRHAGPQKWEGFINLGLENPAATGQVLAVLGAVYPIHGGKIQINPIWDQKILEGNAYVKGRVYGVMLLFMAGRLFFDKNVKYVINWFRRQAGSGVPSGQES